MSDSNSDHGENALEEARQVIKSEINKRVQACGMEIEMVLNKYNCYMDPVCEVSSRGVVAKIRILPLDDKDGGNV